MRLWLWIKSWWTVAGISRQLSSIDSHIQQLSKEKKSLETYIGETLFSIVDTENDAKDVLAESRKYLQQAEALVTKYDEQLEAARSKIRVLEDTTIPTLVAANKVFMERWDAESAIEVRRQTAFQSRLEGE